MPFLEVSLSCEDKSIKETIIKQSVKYTFPFPVLCQQVRELSCNSSITAWKQPSPSDNLAESLCIISSLLKNCPSFNGWYVGTVIWSFCFLSVLFTAKFCCKLSFYFLWPFGKFVKEVSFVWLSHDCSSKCNKNKKHRKQKVWNLASVVQGLVKFAASLTKEEGKIPF